CVFIRPHPFDPLSLRPHPFDPLSLRERGNEGRTSFPLPRKERGTGGEDHDGERRRSPGTGIGGSGVDERAMAPQDTAHGKRGGRNLEPATTGRALEPPLPRPRGPPPYP